MATVNYKINETKKELTKIYVRVRESNIDLEVPIGITVNKNHWNPNKQQVKNLADADNYRITINTALKELETRIISRFNEANTNGNLINNQWLKDVINEFHNKPTSVTSDSKIYLTDFGDSFIEASHSRKNNKTGKPIGYKMKRDYINTNNKLKKYEKKIGKRLRLDSADLTFHADFIKYLREVLYLGENTIGGFISVTKQFLGEAELQGLKVNPAHRSSKFFAPSFKPKDIYFNEDEIEKIRLHKFVKDSYLDNARDWLIIGLWSGLRVSDLLPISKKDVINGFIDNTNFKTDIPVKIPIHPHSQIILDKRNGEFPRQLSDQKFNDYIKEVAEAVGFNEIIDGSKMVRVTDKDNNDILDDDGKVMHRKIQGKYKKFELVTTHICRRSFASNLYGKIETLTIMKITGHATERQFLEYIKITPKIHAERLAQHWKETYQKK